MVKVGGRSIQTTDVPHVDTPVSFGRWETKVLGYGVTPS